MDLQDRVVLLTGGTRIGAAVARDLAAAGAHLALSYRTSGGVAEATAADARALGRRAMIVRADVAHPDECRALVDGVVSELGRLDVLINMASVYEAVGLHSLDDRTWQLNLDVNLSAAFHCTRAAAPHMRARGGGRVINFADWVAQSGRPAYEGFVAYYTAKAGLIGLTEALALELARDRILVNAIAPGPIVPPPDLSPEEQDSVSRMTPLGGWGGEAEVVKAVRWLIESDFTTGETIRVDGGRHLR
jgi:NAD(P)-dependent dehydrogenase (short-subunit alcohol dehydrogenase family)